MRRISLIIVVAALTAASLVFGSSQTPRTGPLTPQGQIRRVPQAQLELERTITTQQRLNRYFHNDVMPKLRNCWRRIQGRGKIEIQHTYARDASGKWVAGKLAVSGSTLERGQQAIALRCMQGSVRGSSFPAEAGESSERTYVVNWTWPVPFPTNAAQLTSAMFAARVNNGTPGSGGCDGEGTPAKCSNCGPDFHSCVTVCVGYNMCSVELGLSCATHGSCASGGPFGVAGGGMIIR
jgi:hypothetical protein